jgi:release factor glutamine methyltransferase
MQIRQLLQQATKLLTQHESARLEAELLLCHCLAVSRSYLYMHVEQIVNQVELTQFQRLLVKRQQGYPIAYLLGNREFWSLDLIVTPDTLIPRSETELLVEVALAKIPLEAEFTLADLGTGSGAIALAIAKERPKATVYAIDKSLAALQVAKQNAQRLQIFNVVFLAADWLTAVATVQLDMIVSNPPYIAQTDPHLTEGDVRFEPAMALAAEDDGLAAYKAIISQTKSILKSEGWLLLEHGYTQAESISLVLQDHGYKVVASLKDLAGKPRVICAQNPC